MSPVLNTPVDKTAQLAQQLLEENTHFIKAVTDVAKQRDKVDPIVKTESFQV